MHHKALAPRPVNRIGHVLSRLAKIWHYYPEHSLRALVTEVTLYANQVDSDFPLTSIAEIEDIPYPEGHLLHELRHLEMGIDAIEEERADEPLPSSALTGPSLTGRSLFSVQGKRAGLSSVSLHGRCHRSRPRAH